MDKVKILESAYFYNRNELIQGDSSTPLRSEVTDLVALRVTGHFYRIGRRISFVN